MDSLTSQFGAQLNLLDIGHAIQANVDVSDLANAFASFTTNVEAPPTPLAMGPNSKHHQLVIAYPSVDLLPRGAEMALDAPYNLIHRERPMRTAFSENAYPDVVLRLSAQANVTYGVIPQFIKHDYLESMVERLKAAPGFSVLKVMTYKVDGQDSTMYSFRLETTWVIASTSNDSVREIQNAVINADEWKDVCVQGAEVEWVRILQSHVNRATDFSFIRVQDRLAQQHPLLAQQEFDKHASQWDTAPLVNANNILKMRMLKMRQIIAENVQDMYFIPCGHVFQATDTYLMCVMSEKDCKAAVCQFCKRPILNSTTDALRLAIVRDRRHRIDYKRQENAWIELTNRFGNKMAPRPGLAYTTAFTILCKDFRTALVNSRRSFHLPSSAMPHELNFANFPETREILTMLLKNLSRDYQPMLISREATMGLLLNFAVEMLKQHTGLTASAQVRKVLPPQYRAFLLSWFSRALALAYRIVKRREESVQAVAELVVQKPDDGYKLGYKLDLGARGKRRKSFGHHAFGDVKERERTPSFLPREEDWEREEQVFE